MDASQNGAAPAPNPDRSGRGGSWVGGWCWRAWTARLCLAPAILAASLIAVSCNSLHALMERVTSERQAKIRAAVEMAYGAVARAGDLVASGQMARAEAQRAAAETVRALRYEDGQYLWINDLEPRMIMHPVSPELEGRDLTDYVSPCGARLFVEFVRTAQARPAGGFVKHRSPKLSGGAPVDKLSFVKLYEPWGWVIGSGTYLDDLQSVLAAESRRIIGSTVLLAVLLCAGGAVVARIARRAERLKVQQERFEATAKRHERALQTLTQCKQALVDSGDEQTLLDSVCRILVESGGYRMAWVGFAEHDERKTIRPVAVTGDDGGYLSRVESVWADTVQGSGPVGAAIRTGKPAIASDILSDATWAPWRAEAQKRGYACAVGLPLVASGAALGAMGICAAEWGCFDDDEMKLLAEIAHDLVSGILSLRARREHQRMMSQLAQADRLAAMGSLAAGVAHEISDPLAHVTAGLEFVAQRARSMSRELGPERLRELEDVLAETRDGCDRIRQVVRGLKTFSRGDERSPRPLDVREVFERSSQIASSEIRRRARLAKEYGATPLVQADETRLGQVFLNMLVNAAQAIPEGAADSNEIRIATWTDSEGRAVIEVSDRGAGIPAEHIGRIFEPFFTTKPRGVGTGLGLSISRDLVAAMGGEITARSEVGKGSAFRVILPAARASAPDPPPARGDEVPGRRGRVLAVDDEPFLVHAIQRLLSPEHEVVVETSPQGALERVVSGERFDVIVCGLMMPGKSGIDFHAEVARLDPALADRMVFLTAGAVTPRTKAFVERMQDRVLEKPFDAEALRSLVRDLVP